MLDKHQIPHGGRNPKLIFKVTCGIIQWNYDAVALYIIKLLILFHRCPLEANTISVCIVFTEKRDWSKFFSFLISSDVSWLIDDIENQRPGKFVLFILPSC